MDILGLAGRLGRCCRYQRIQKFDRRLRRLGHLVGQVPRRKVGIAEQRTFLRAELGQPRDGGPRVVGIVALGAVPRVLKDRLPRGAISQKGQVRLLRGVLQRNYPSLLLALLGILCRRGDLRFAQAGQRRRVRGRVSSGFGSPPAACS